MFIIIHILLRQAHEIQVQVRTINHKYYNKVQPHHLALVLIKVAYETVVKERRDHPVTHYRDDWNPWTKAA